MFDLIDVVRLMKVEKLFWMVRALCLKPFSGSWGFKSYLGKPIFINNIKKMYIGSKVRIYPMARIEVFDSGKVCICDNVSIGQCFHLISANNVFIGENTTISANVFISDLDHQYSSIDVHIMEQPLIVRTTIIGNNCFIGYGAVIQAGTKLGKQCIVGANSVVRGTFEDYCVIAGVPARVIKRYNFDNQIWQKTDCNGHFI